MLVLASASPRRQELLRNAGIAFAAQAADLDETPLPGEGARGCAERLAREKAMTISRQRPNDDVLGADTVVVLDQAILNKPTDADDAIRMLRLLSGRTHQVITGVCLVKPVPSSSQFTVPRRTVPGSLRPGAPYELVMIDNRQLLIGSETTLVTMSDIPEEQIVDYVATGEPMDKAGAYAIQGRASRWIPRIEGDYSSVVGLPIALVYRMLQSLGCDSRG